LEQPPEHDEIEREMIALAIKAGRRASYDLRHACGFIDDPMWRDRFEDRASHWLSIFDMDSGMKDYTHSLHKEINRLEYEVERLERLLQEHNIKDPDKIPF
jgi:hypothetical protein